MTSEACARVLGVPVHAATLERWTEFVAHAIATGERAVMPHQNLHGLYVYRRSPGMRALHRAWEPYIDGMSLVLLARLGGHRLGRQHRVTMIDWLPVLLQRAADEGWRVYYLGSSPDVVERGAEILRGRFEGLQLAVDHGYFDASHPEANGARIARINRYAPHLLFVGMGMPRQEEWTAEHLEHLDADVVVMTGAALDYFAGAIPTPPRWMGRIGLEWLYRLLCEPRRLAKRYLVEPWFLLGWLLRDLAARFRPGRAPAADGACAWHRDPASRSRRVPPMNGTSTGALPIEDVLEREQQGSWSR